MANPKHRVGELQVTYLVTFNDGSTTAPHTFTDAEKWVRRMNADLDRIGISDAPSGVFSIECKVTRRVVA